jgi:hypothetical protein
MMTPTFQEDVQNEGSSWEEAMMTTDISFHLAATG